MNATVEVLITLTISDKLVDRLRQVSPRLHVTVQPARKNEEVPSEVWNRTEVLFTDQVVPDPAQAPNLKWIQFSLAGVDAIANASIVQDPDVTVTTLSGAAVSQMAEFALMLMLALGHRLYDTVGLQARAEWPRDRIERLSPRELRDSTVGIVGYGSIGRQIARVLQSFGATVLAAKRDVMHPEDTGYMVEGMGDPNGDFFQRLYPIEALRSMLKDCDFVVVTAPLTPSTRKLVSKEEFEAMKPSAFLIDMSRGGVVDQAALIEALQEKRIAGAGLDVFPEEPLPSSSPLWKMPNVLITPHVSGISSHYSERAMALFEENMNRYLVGMPLYNRFDPQKGY